MKRIRLHARLACLATTILFLACRRDPTDLAIEVATRTLAQPTADAVVWLTAADGERHSMWLQTTPDEALPIASRHDLALPSASGVWLWQEIDIAVATCDCAAWKSARDAVQCPASDQPSIVHNAVLRELQSGEEIIVLDASAADSMTAGLAQAEGRATPLASLGPYLFVESTVRHIPCSAAQTKSARHFKVIDLDTKQEVALLTDPERAQIDAVERQFAFKSLSRGPFDTTKAEDLELFSIVPRFGAPVGAWLAYEFLVASAEAQGADAFLAHSRSVAVPATTIPIALAPYLSIPPCLAPLFRGPQDAVFSGWTPISGDGDRLAALRGAFAGARAQAVEPGEKGTAEP